MDENRCSVLNQTPGVVNFKPEQYKYLNNNFKKSSKFQKPKHYINNNENG